MNSYRCGSATSKTGRYPKSQAAFAKSRPVPLVLLSIKMRKPFFMQSQTMWDLPPQNRHAAPTACMTTAGRHQEAATLLLELQSVLEATNSLSRDTHRYRCYP